MTNLTKLIDSLTHDPKAGEVIKVLRDALFHVIEHAPTEKPEYQDTNNCGDIASQAIDGFHFRLAQTAFKALADAERIAGGGE